MDDLHAYINPKNGLHQPMISDEIHEIITKNADVRDALSFALIFNALIYRGLIPPSFMTEISNINSSVLRYFFVTLFCVTTRSLHYTRNCTAILCCHKLLPDTSPTSSAVQCYLFMAVVVLRSGTCNVHLTALLEYICIIKVVLKKFLLL